MPRQMLERWVQRLLRQAATGHAFLVVCLLLSCAGTATAAYPVTAIVVPATLLAARRWRAIALSCALGSAFGATLLVMFFHDVGWAQLYEQFPEMAKHSAWQSVIAWTSEFGLLALFFIALSPLPQTPALIFFGAAHSDYLLVFVAMLAGKLVKYGLFAWGASHFPERVDLWLRALWRDKRDG